MFAFRVRNSLLVAVFLSKHLQGFQYSYNSIQPNQVFCLWILWWLHCHPNSGSVRVHRKMFLPAPHSSEPNRKGLVRATWRGRHGKNSFARANKSKYEQAASSNKEICLQSRKDVPTWPTILQIECCGNWIDAHILHCTHIGAMFGCSSTCLSCTVLACTST